MKILAAIMDVVHVKKDRKIKQYYITKIKRCLVYDPTKVTVRQNEKEKDNEY